MILLQCLGIVLDISCVLIHLILTALADCISKDICSCISHPTHSSYNSDTLATKRWGTCDCPPPHLNLGGLGTNSRSDPEASKAGSVYVMRLLPNHWTTPAGAPSHPVDNLTALRLTYCEETQASPQRETKLRPHK